MCAVNEINDLKEQLKGIDESIAEGAFKKVELTERVDMLKNKKVQPHEPAGQLRTMISALEDKLIKSHYELNQLTEKEVRLKDLETSISRLDEYTDLFNIHKMIKKALGISGLKGDLIKESIDPFVNKMNELLESFNREETFYIETESSQGKPILDFGWVREGKNISFESLSGGEYMINALCMVATFISIKKCNWQVLLLDEVNNLFGSTLRDVMETTGKMQIDNIIMAGAKTAEESGADRYYVITMGDD